MEAEKALGFVLLNYLLKSFVFFIKVDVWPYTFFFQVSITIFILFKIRQQALQEGAAVSPRSCSPFFQSTVCFFEAQETGERHTGGYVSGGGLRWGWGASAKRRYAPSPAAKWSKFIVPLRRDAVFIKSAWVHNSGVHNRCFEFLSEMSVR